MRRAMSSFAAWRARSTAAIEPGKGRRRAAWKTAQANLVRLGVGESAQANLVRLGRGRLARPGGEGGCGL